MVLWKYNRNLNRNRMMSRENDRESYGVTVMSEHLLIIEKNENSMGTGNARAREGTVTACHFVDSGHSDACGHSLDGEPRCGLLADVPEGTDPREWYVRQLAWAASELGGGAL